MLLSDDSDQPIVVTQLLLFRGLRAAFFSNFAIDDDSIYFSALVLIFPAFGTRHTFYADRAAAFLKYLRFSRQIDWNNFSHTDSSAVPSNVPSRSRKTVVICLLLVPCFPFFLNASWAFRKFTAALPGALGETNFRYF